MYNLITNIVLHCYLKKYTFTLWLPGFTVSINKLGLNSNVERECQLLQGLQMKQALNQHAPVIHFSIYPNQLLTNIYSLLQ